MRCPKCGAFLEDGKDICFMCGTNVKTYVPNATNNPTMNIMNNNNQFNNMANNTGASFGSGSDFSSPNQNYNPMNNINHQSNFNDYKNAKLAPLKDEEKDIFDKYHEHKQFINACIAVVIILIIGFAGFKYHDSKAKGTLLEPKLQNLYFYIDKDFQKIKDDRGGVTYSMSGAKGNDCSINVNIATDTSADHVKGFYKWVETQLEPARDSYLNIIDRKNIYIKQTNELVINGAEWYSMNAFYNKNVNNDNDRILKYKYLTSIYKGYYYDIKLVNNNDSAVCSAALDNFVKSLKFVESGNK